MRRGEEVLFFIHKDVPGTVADPKSGKVTASIITEHNLESRIAQYSMPVATLREYTAKAKEQLGSSCSAEPQGV